MKLKRGDKVRIIAGKDKGKEGKVLVVDRKAKRVIVEGLNMIKKHTKPNQADQKGGIIKKEAPIDVSNVMYLHKGKPVRIGFKVTLDEKGKVTNKVRIARPSGEVID